MPSSEVPRSQFDSVRTARAIIDTMTLSEKVYSPASSGALSVSVSKGCGMGFGHEKPGSATVLLRCSEGQVPYRTGIDPDSDPDFDFDFGIPFRPRHRFRQ